MRVLILLCWLLPSLCLAGSQAVLTPEHLLTTDGSRVRAWRRPALTPDAALGKALASQPVTHLAVDGQTLWATSGSWLVRWQPRERTWKRVQSVGAKVLGLASYRSQPVLLLPTEVLVGGRRFPVPKLTTGQVQTNVLESEDFLVHGDTLWVANGYGEWGGHIRSLNLATGVWSVRVNDYQYPLALAPGSKGQLWASWGQSHGSRDRAFSVLRLHEPDGSTASSQHFKGAQLVGLLAGPGGTILGVDSTRLVRVEASGLVELGTFTGTSRDQQHWLLAPDPDTVVVIPPDGLPLALRAGKLERLPVEP